MIWPLRKTPVQLPAALCGKLPCQSDFVREGLRSAASTELDAFLVTAAAALHESGGFARLGQALFCQCLPGHAQGLVGLCAPSHDAQQRAFPVAIARAFDRMAWRSQLGQIFTSASTFLDEANSLLTALPELQLEDVRTALARLPEPDRTHAIAPPPAAADLDRLFGVDPSARCYALYTLAAAFANAPRTRPKRSALSAQATESLGQGVAIDCPLQQADHAAVWLELTSQIAEQLGTTLCVLYQPAQRLLITVGGWNPWLLSALAQPERELSGIWPLTTHAPEAREYTRIALQGCTPWLARTAACSLQELAGQLARFSKTLRT